MEVRPTASPLQERPSLRPLALLLGALGALWLVALGLIVAQLA
jgi:hypothetical protein